MNMFVRAKSLSGAETETVPTPDEVEAAREILRRYEETRAELDASVAETVSAPPVSRDLNRSYPEAFVADDAYRATLPDLQNGPESLIKGAKRQIQHVGISNFRLPLTYQTRSGTPILLETSITGSVSLDATKKGINMSRIMRSFYKHADKPFNLGEVSGVLETYLQDLDSCDARIQLKFRFPILKRSLRSGLEGYQYYDVALEVVQRGSHVTPIVHLDYVYSSTCPCSLELSEHARRERGQIATPHSQRSVARVSAVVENGQEVWIEDLVDLCTRAIPTETQVMVKREDEQAFAELNGSNPIFVEDAVRLMCQELQNDTRLGDFRVVASHQESLHSHDAVSILTSGPTFDQTSHDPKFFSSLYHAG